LSHSASFQPKDKIAPSNAGTKHLVRVDRGASHRDIKSPDCAKRAYFEAKQGTARLSPTPAQK
jgi:hypothetical protein